MEIIVHVLCVHVLYVHVLYVHCTFVNVDHLSIKYNLDNKYLKGVQPLYNELQGTKLILTGVAAYKLYRYRYSGTYLIWSPLGRSHYTGDWSIEAILNEICNFGT